MEMDAYPNYYFQSVLVNTCGTLCALFAYNVKSMWWVDPLGAIILASKIMSSWYQQGKGMLYYILLEGLKDAICCLKGYVCDG